MLKSKRVLLIAFISVLLIAFNSYYFFTVSSYFNEQTGFLVAYITLHMIVAFFSINELAKDNSSSPFTVYAVALLFLTFSWVLCMLTGKPFSGGTSPFHFMVLILFGTLLPAKAAVFVIGFDFLAMTGFYLLHPGLEGVVFFMLHIGFGVMFALYYRFILEGELIFRRKQFAIKLANFYKEINKKADYYGLKDSEEEGPTENAETKLAGIGQIEGRINQIFSLLQNYPGIERAVIYLKNPDPAKEFYEPVHGFGSIQREQLIPIEAKNPFIRPFIQAPTTVTRSSLMQSVPPPYLGKSPYGEFSASPIFDEESQFSGLLVVDSANGKRLPPSIESIIEHSSMMIATILKGEKQIASLDSNLRQQGVFFETLKELNTAVDQKSLYKVISKLLREVIQLDYLAITSFNESNSSLEVLYEMGSDTNRLPEIIPDIEGSVTESVIKEKMPMPMDRFQASSSKVLISGEDFSKLKFLRVYPMLVRNNVIGTLVLGAAETAMINQQQHEYITFLTDHVAFGVLNAILYREMERKAISDGLTGLYNHRKFQDLMDESIFRAERIEKEFALLLVDVDHFKKVNDVHGHQLGDQVLQRLSQILKASCRKTDWPCRYGGEEFAVIAENSHFPGAMQLAERIRNAIQNEEFESAAGKFRVTLSIGISMYGADSRDKETLIKFADEALYCCKERGRNMTLSYSAIAQEAKEEDGSQVPA